MLKNGLVPHSDLVANNRKEPLVIFGTGESAIRYFFILLENDVYVDCFCDSEDSKVGQLIVNKKVIPFVDLKKMKENAFVVICSMYYVEIYENLLSQGFLNLYLGHIHTSSPLPNLKKIL